MREHWKKKTITLSDLYRGGPIAFRNQAKAIEIVNILENHKYLFRNTKDGKGDTWTVNIKM